MNDPLFHAGERLVQERTGERATALANARSIGPRIPAAARLFVSQQRICVLGAATSAGGVQASIVAGAPGFVQASEDLATLHLALAGSDAAASTNMLLDDLRTGQSIAALLIELQTRRRLRINGHVARIAAGALDVGVGQAFAVCPRYIQKREPIAGLAGAMDRAAPPLSGTELTPDVAERIARSDTLFIASLGPQQDADASHRGGRSGFVQVEGQTLRIPDFNGNSMFNTLGNLVLDSRCGLVIPDFEQATQLQLSGRAEVCFDVAEGNAHTGGTGRWIAFQVDHWRISPLNVPLRWRYLEASPYNP